MQFGIQSKMILLVAALSLAAFAGFGVFLVNTLSIENIYRNVMEKYNQALAREAFDRFYNFLDSIEASAGTSLALAENFYNMRHAHSRSEMEAAITKEYHRAFAPEYNLLGGGVFYEPYAFYPDVYDFHYFASKKLTGTYIPLKEGIQWTGNEFAWDLDTYAQSWYQAALPKDWDRERSRGSRAYWSELYIDKSVDALMVSVCLPVYGDGQRIVGVATADVSLFTLQSVVHSVTLPTPSSKVAGFSTINKATFSQSDSGNRDIVPYPEDSWLRELANLQSSQSVENKDLYIDGKSYTLYASVHHSGIGLAMLVPNGEKFREVEALYRTSAFTAIAACIFMALIVVMVVLALNRWIARPLGALVQNARRIGRGEFDARIDVKGNDEVAELGTAFNKMTADIKVYIENLKNITVEKERINSELSIAAGIQNDMLPAIFPVFSGHECFSLFAKMEPAKAVGGDFYDFFFLDERQTKIALIIADVCDKGVPAALFMVIAKTLIKQQLLQSNDPAEALLQVNRVLCDNNPQSMFVTAFVLCVDLITGQSLYTNGGHLPPILSRAKGPFGFLPLKTGTPPGMIDKSKYSLCFLQLEPGDKLYLYTDGITEAMNFREEQFGSERLLATANRALDSDPEEFDGIIRRAVAEFTEGAEQSDDVTSLCLHFNKNAPPWRPPGSLSAPERT